MKVLLFIIDKHKKLHCIILITYFFIGAQVEGRVSQEDFMVGMQKIWKKAQKH